MNTLRSSARRALVWIAPVALLALLLAWQTDWGRAFARTPPAEIAAAPAPLSIALLPEYQPAAAPDKNKDAVERTLFNPTRRPAPVAVAEAVKPKMQRGQFTLAGTIVVDGKTTAFLKEVNGGKPRRVRQGESVNGMTVAQVARRPRDAHDGRRERGPHPQGRRGSQDDHPAGGAERAGHGDRQACARYAAIPVQPGPGGRCATSRTCSPSAGARRAPPKPPPRACRPARRSRRRQAPP